MQGARDLRQDPYRGNMLAWRYVGYVRILKWQFVVAVEHRGTYL